MKTLLAILGLALMLAGCAGDDDLDAGGANLQYEGKESGTHSDMAEGCDDEGTLVGSGNVEDGTLEVTVTDGDGAVVFEKTYDGGVDTEGERVEGSSGDWKLTAVRSTNYLVGDSFNGQYAFALTC